MTQPAELQIRLQNPTSPPLSCFTVYWNNQRFRITLTNEDKRLGFLPKDFKDKIEPQLLEMLNGQTGLDQTATQFSLQTAKKSRFSTYTHSDIAVNEATQQHFQSKIEALITSIKADSSIQCFYSDAPKEEKKSLLGNAQSESAKTNLETITRDPISSMRNPLKTVMDPRQLQLATMNTYLAALQKEHADGGKYFYYQCLSSSEIDISNVHPLSHPNQPDVPTNTGKQYLVINTGKGWVSFTIDLPNNQIYFYNSKNEPLESSKALKKFAQDLIDKHTIITEITQNSVHFPHQKDDYNSGRYQLAFITAMAADKKFSTCTNKQINAEMIEESELQKMTALLQKHTEDIT
ncbi:MAG: hypothetical protein KAR79_04445 [Simkaniaceae bacterium]|nr:hypothetical protein [Simkaniaceae bacterium]